MQCLENGSRQELELVYFESRREIRHGFWPDQKAVQATNLLCSYRPIPFENVLTILVSISHLLRDEKKGRKCASYVKGEKGEGCF